MVNFYSHNTIDTSLSSRKSRFFGLMLMFFSFALLPLSSFGQVSKTFITSGTYIPPAGITTVTAECWGAGGGGGSVFLSGYGGGGGGGAYTRASSVSVLAISSYTINVGYGGGSNNNGNSSQAILGTTVTANGGEAGGFGAWGSDGAGGLGGAGGTRNGGSGATGTNSSSGGGGGSAGTASNGNNASGGTGGTAVAGGGAGANGRSSNGNGSSGSFPGGGGSGGYSSNWFTNGGTGGDGQVIITSPVCPVYGITSISGTSPICINSNNTITVLSTAGLLPAGTYNVTYNTTNPVQTGLKASMVVNPAGGGTFTATGFNTAGTSTVTVTALSSGSSSSDGAGVYICTTNSINKTTPGFTVNAIPTVVSTGGNSKVYDRLTNTTTVSATASSGATIQWFANSSGGTSLGSGSTYAPTAINAGTYTVYAEANNGGCVSTARTAVTLTINPKALTVTGATVTSKTYDGTTSATITGAVLSGVLAGDTGNVTLGNATTGTFNNANVGTGKAVTTAPMTISGSASGNYTLTQPTLTGDITAKGLTVTGATVTTKTYDGTTGATITGGSLNGVLAADVANVTLGNATTGTFNNANVGIGKIVTTAPMTISGSASGNYILTQPSLTGTITAASLTITANNRSKCYGSALTLGTTAFITTALQNGETVTSVTLTSTGGYDASLTQAAALYSGDIVPSNPMGTFSASNYVITLANGDLTINALPAITTQPASLVVCENTSGSFTVVSPSSPTYQWQYNDNVGSGWGNVPNGSGVSGATTYQLSFSSAPLGFSGYSVRCVLTLGSCSVTSAAVTLTVNPKTKINSQSTATQTKCAGAAFSPITVTATGTGTLTYQWYSRTTSGTTGGTNLGSSNGAQTNSYTPQSTTAGTLYYYCIVTGDCSFDKSAASGAFVVNPTPTLSTATQTIFACSQGGGSPATLKLTGLLNGAFDVDYTIDGVSQPQQSLTAVAGEATFDTRILSIADDGKLVQITAITTPTCSKSFAGIAGIDLNLNVKANSGAITLTPGATIASGGLTTASELTNVTFSIDPIPGATTYTWYISPNWTVISPDVTTNSITVKTGTRFQSDNVTVTADDMFCPSSIMVTLTGIAPQPPIENDVTDATCKVKGDITLGNLPVGNWQLTTIKDGGAEEFDATSRTGSTFLVPNLDAGTYTFKVTDTYGTSLESDPMVVGGIITNTWNGTTWSNGGIAPNVEQNVVISSDVSGPVNACSCLVDSNVTIASGILNVVNGLTVTGSLTFEEGAYLVQDNNTNTNVGSITFKLSHAVTDYEYVYWSSPVSTGGLGAFSTINKSFSFLNNAWVGANTSPGNGFIVRYVDSGTQAPNFVGVPNNGQITVAGSSTGSSLIGNPYPSPIYASSFVAENSGLSGGLYIWNSGTTRTINGSGTKFVYNGSYSVVNGTGSVGMGDEIGPGVGFFVSGSGFVFNNDMRLAPPSGNGGNFSKIANTKKTKATEKNRVWLKLTKESEELSQLLVGYVTDATNDFDKLYDATAFGGTDFDFYSIANSKQYTIQGRGLPFDTADEIPLGYKTVLDGVLAVDIEKVDGNFVGESIYLEDKTTNTIHDLTKGPYSFTTAKGEFKDRFVLRYTDTAKLGTDEVTAKENGVMVSVKKRQIKINSFDQTLSAVKLFDVKGSLLYEKKNINTNEFKIDNLQSKTQFMIVMIQLENGKSISEKIIFQE
jgi:hypothetical protein